MSSQFTLWELLDQSALQDTCGKTHDWLHGDLVMLKIPGAQASKVKAWKAHRPCGKDPLHRELYSGPARCAFCRYARTCARSAIEQHAARGVDANLAVQLVVRQGQLHSLPDLLLLHVQPANVLHVQPAVAAADNCVH